MGLRSDVAGHDGGVEQLHLAMRAATNSRSCLYRGTHANKSLAVYRKSRTLAFDCIAMILEFVLTTTVEDRPAVEQVQG